MRKTQKRKLSSVNENQLETLEDFLVFLKNLGVLADHHVVCRLYRAPITTYLNGTVDSQWCSLYEIEEIVIVEANGYGAAEG